MAASSAVTTGDIATAAQYNNLRTDVLDSSSSHTHAGTSNTGVKVNSNNLQGTVLASTVVTSSLTTVGTIATGVWQGTDVGVAYGGTGVSTLTDGGVLLGSGASAITAMAVLADSEMIVGDGTTDPVAESGATLRTSIGVGTGDSPQFTDLTLTDDLTLNSDSSVFKMGDDDGFSITHDGDLGATIAGSPITITAAEASTWSTSSGVLTIDGDDGIILQTTGSGGVTISEATRINVDAGSIATPDASTGLTLVNSSATGDGVQLSLISGNAGYGQIWFGDVNDENRGRFNYKQDTDTFGWSTATAASMYLSGGISPTLQLGVDSDADSKIIFETNTAGYHIGWDQSADALVIGAGYTLGTTPAVTFDRGVASANMRVKGDHITTGYVMDVQTGGASSITTGNILRVYGGTGSTDTRNMVYFNQAHASASGTTAVKIDQAGAGLALHVDSGTSRFDGVIDASTATRGFAIGDADDTERIMYNNSQFVFLSGGNAYEDVVTGPLFINETANANMTTGLTINQGAADDQAFALKSSDVDHGLTTGTAGGSDVEIDDYFTIEKMVAGTSGGGVRMNVMMEDVAQRPAFQLGVYGGTAQTDKSTSARGLAEIYVSEHADNNSLADIAANGNVFNISARVGDTDATVFLVDEDGQIYATTNAHTGDVSVGALSDNYDDAQLVRTLDHAKTSAGFKGMIRDKWDDFVQYNEQDLIDAGVLGETMENGGLLNVTGLQKLHNGAIWQGYKRQMELQEEVTELKTRLLALEGAK